MKAAIYNPYLDTLGGGERYTMAFANALMQKGYDVDIEWKDNSVKKKLEDRFGIDLGQMNIVNDVKRGDGYDLIFWLSDGSIPTLRSRNNFLHFQFPFTDVGGKSLLNKMKLFRIKKIICNSKFTKKRIDKEYGVESIVIYPPVDTEHIKPKRKENIILSVGRFSQLTQAKRQDVLIKAFKKVYKTLNESWKLVLAGGTDVGVDDYLLRLKKSAKGLPVEIVEKPTFETIKTLFGKSKIYWSASGYGVDVNKEPKKVEHLGIAVVEAMSSGSVPVVYNAGGHKETVKENVNGYLWKKEFQLVRKTLSLVNDQKLLIKLSKSAIERSKLYSYQKFNERVFEILQ